MPGIVTASVPLTCPRGRPASSSSAPEPFERLTPVSASVTFVAATATSPPAVDSNETLPERLWPRTAIWAPVTTKLLTTAVLVKLSCDRIRRCCPGSRASG